MNIGNIILWAIQVYLVYWFFGPAKMKLLTPTEKLVQYHLVPSGGSPTPIRILAVLEFLGIAGLILPWITGILPILTPVSALCLGLVMVGAAFFQFKTHNTKKLPKIVLALILCLLVAWFRYQEMG